MVTRSKVAVEEEQVKRPPTKEEKVEALTNYWKFLDLIDFHGGSKAFGECHRELIDWHFSHDADKEFIIMPRGHLKSTLMTVGMTLWRIYQNPNIRIFVGTATKDLALAFVSEIKQYLEDEWLGEVLWNDRPHISGRLIPVMDKLARQRRLERDETEALDKKVMWRADAIQVLRSKRMKEPTVCTGAVGVRHTGFHYDELKLDDVVNFDNISTPEKLKKLLRWVKDLYSVLDKKRIVPTLVKWVGSKLAAMGGKVSVVGTRYAAEDWYNKLIEAKQYATYQRNIYKNGENNEDGYLWHEEWDAEYEAQKKEDIDDAAVWASQYLNLIINPEDQVFKFDAIGVLQPSQVNLRKNGTVEIWFPLEEKPRQVNLFCVVDPAAAVGVRADFTAIVVGGKDEQKRLYVVDGALGRWKSNEILVNLFKLLDKWHLNRVSIESVGGFKHLVEYVKTGFTTYRPITIYEFRPQGNKQRRIANALEPLVSNQMLFMMLWMHSHREIKTQFEFFPQATIHDDFIDAVAALQEIAQPPARVVHRPMRGKQNKRYGGYR